MSGRPIRQFSGTSDPINPEPLHYAIVHHLYGDVEAKLITWQSSLDQRPDKVVADFTDQLKTLTAPTGVPIHEFAEAQADVAIDRWCQRRDEYAREIVANLNPESVALAQQLGVAAELGRLVGLHLDNTLRDLDSRLRAAIEDTAVRQIST